MLATGIDREGYNDMRDMGGDTTGDMGREYNARFGQGIQREIWAGSTTRNMCKE